MTTIDFTPLFRSSVGFDRMASLMDTVNRVEQPNFPPYNIERVDEDQYRITMAVAGFSEAELDIEVEQNRLKVTGAKATSERDRSYLHQGIAARNFERTFQLDDHIKVVGAGMEHGLLNIELEREIPEAMKPRKIEIAGAAAKTLIEGKQENAA